MGTPKVLLEVDGRPLGQRAAQTLRAAGAQMVVLVGADAATGEALALAAIADDRPGEGPLAGLATALRWADDRGAEVLLLAACDQPDLPAPLLRSLIRALGAAPEGAIGAVAATADGRQHPFPSAWRASAAPAVDVLVADGARRMVDALGLGVVAVPAPADALVDLDTPDDLRTRVALGAPPAPVDCPDPAPAPRGAPVDVPEIDIAETAARIAAGTPVIDVREPDEYREGHVPGAVLIPLGEIAERSDEVPAEGEVLIICKLGGRSRRAAEHLRSLGIDATNVGGGTMAWIDAGQPVVPGDEPGA